ncbi:hypothetical protein [Streptococcus jiangjianxini]|uniref:hypothetical protein n=1 Tax=Streptococcus jiangjianxini TaxID=3161189 RepID=UPI0032EC38CB
MSFADFLNKKQEEWNKSYPLPDFAAMSDEELLKQPMSDAFVDYEFAKKLSEELKKRHLWPK